MNRSLLLICFVFTFTTCFCEAADTKKQPNVLFIAVDDLNDWTNALGGYPGVKTPNLDRIQKQGMQFSRAYCAAPSCNPSRAALMTGVRPSTSGVYSNSQPWRPVMPNAVTMGKHFMNNGYHVVGGGKIYHGRYKERESWHEYYTRPGDAKPKKLPANGIKNTSHFDWGPVQKGNEAFGDWQLATWAEEQIAKKRDKPLFLAVGFFRPHLPWYAPQKYFDQYPIDKIKLPNVPADDLKDIPAAGIKMARPDRDHAKVTKSNNWEKAVQGYLANITFVDECIGRVLDAIEKSPEKDNTIIVLWSDHGWHLGEKEHWRKFALWEAATRVNLYFNVPGMTKAGSESFEPVNLLDMYPTLCELCSVPVRKELEGQSLVPLLKDPEKEINRVSITTYGFKNHTIRNRDFRYIQYADGSEELYDHTQDQEEFTNLAKQEKYQAVINKLKKHIPAVNTPFAKP